MISLLATLRTLARAWILAPLLVVHGAAGAAESPSVTLSIGAHQLTAEVATTPEQRAKGLMHRFSLKPNQGMLFDFERPGIQGFWMKNTYIPLSIAFIAADGRILNIEDMQPHSEDVHRSKGPALYALEMRKGWFAEKDIVAGSKVSGLPLRR
ncbi:MAG: DUF192 domain-containing protein [Betaproteobacteria bacterium]|nr:DUF192 domain-containing protein [Betaproteobacteria bacterium]